MTHRSSTPGGPARPCALGLVLVVAGCSGGGGEAPAGADPGAGAAALGSATPGLRPQDDAPDVPARVPLRFDRATGARHPGTGAFPHANDASPANPWLDWRFDLTLVAPTGRALVVPGFFAGDGVGGQTGDVWSVCFTPPAEYGQWTGALRLRRGSEVNVAEPFSNAGTVVFTEPVTFNVVPNDGTATGLFAGGVIRAAADGRLRDATGALFVKAGAGSPENLLGYAGFDGVVDGIDGGPSGETGGAPDFLHRFTAHVGDWHDGEPDWNWPDGTPGAGRGIVGALNDLAQLGANAIYVLPMNLGGDGRDAYPFFDNGGGALAPNDATHTRRYSVTRLEQWSQVLEHAQRRGLFTQFVLAEREAANIAWLGAADSVERRLFQKMLVARFGYLPGVEWTLCEENAAPSSGGGQFSPSELADMAHWIRAWDTSEHPRSVHTDPNDTALLQALISTGNHDWIECASLQVHGDETATQHLYGALAEEVGDLFRTQAGREIVVHVDEPGNFEVGIASDLHASAWSGIAAAGPADRRRRVLYDALFSGAGVLWYFGLWDEADGGGDLTTEDFDTRAEIFRVTRAARLLVEETFAASSTFGPADDLWTSDVAGGLLHPDFGGAEVVAAPGGPALVYLPEIRPDAEIVLGTLGALDTTNPPGTRPGALQAQWMNARLGVLVGTPVAMDPTLPFTPDPPSATSTGDWVLVVR